MQTTHPRTHTPRFRAVTDTTFDEVVGAADRPVVVDVWATWCPHCHALEPMLASVADDYADGLAVVALDADANPEVVLRHGVMSLPTLLVFDQGALVARLTGARSRTVLLQELASCLPQLLPDRRSGC